MNIKEELTCKYCNQIYKNPITLTCGDNVCKHHIEELVLSNNSSNKFPCPLCNKQNLNLTFEVNKLIEKLIKKELHEFRLNPKYEKTLNNLHTEIRKLEAILNDPHNYIYNEVSELKRLVDLDREKFKKQIDTLADDLITQLESYEARFKAECEKNVDLNYFNNLVESSKRQLAEYETCLNLFSVEIEKRDEKFKASETLIDTIQPKIKELKDKLFSNVSIKYKQMENNIENVFGKLIIQEKRTKVKKEFLGTIKQTLTGHSASVYALAILNNGDLISGSSDNTLKIWNLHDGTVKQTLNSHADWLRDIIVLENNKIVNADQDFSINIRDLNDGSIKKKLTGHTGAISALALLKNGSIASGSFDTTIKIWNIQDGTLKRTLTGHTGTIWALAVLNNGDLVSGSLDKAIQIWDADSGVVLKTLTGHKSGINNLILLQNGDLVSGSDDLKIKIWNIQDGSVKRTLSGHTRYVFALKQLENGDLVSGSEDGTIKIWDVATGTIKQNLDANSRTNSLEVLDNGDLVSASHESIIIWE